ncbi:MAG: hypothetical protein HY581_09480 [Nitrospirae bacterium]|nr:hypothetical protein [Nitrospirota bacterium]
MMKALALGTLVSLAVIGTGCALFIPKETLYLRSATDRATQEEVKQELGPPRLMSSTQTGESVWVYEVREIEPGSQNTWATAGSWCDEYVLTFDGQGILRRWAHRTQFHGGEMMPTYCVRDGFKPAS